MPARRGDFDEVGFQQLQASTEIRAALLDIGDRIARKAAADAPKRTGFGASTIHAEALRRDSGWTVRVGWSPAADYLRFHEFGTRYMPADPFLEPAAEGFL
jgi:HK97 gp10 family phage protein